MLYQIYEVHVLVTNKLGVGVGGQEEKRMINKYLNVESEPRGEPLGPLASHPVVFRPVLSVLSSNAPNQRVGRITVCQKGTNGQQHFGDSQSRTPIVLQNVQTDHTLAVNIAMVNPCSKCHLQNQSHKSIIFISISSCHTN